MPTDKIPHYFYFEFLNPSFSSTASSKVSNPFHSNITIFIFIRYTVQEQWQWNPYTCIQIREKPKFTVQTPLPLHALNWEVGYTHIHTRYCNPHISVLRVNYSSILERMVGPNLYIKLHIVVDTEYTVQLITPISK